MCKFCHHKNKSSSKEKWKDTHTGGQCLFADCGEGMVALSADHADPIMTGSGIFSTMKMGCGGSLRMGQFGLLCCDTDMELNDLDVRSKIESIGLPPFLDSATANTTCPLKCLDNLIKQQDVKDHAEWVLKHCGLDIE